MSAWLERAMEWFVLIGLWAVGIFCALGILGSAVRVWIEVSK